MWKKKAAALGITQKREKAISKAADIYLTSL